MEYGGEQISVITLYKVAIKPSATKIFTRLVLVAYSQVPDILLTRRFYRVHHSWTGSKQPSSVPVLARIVLVISMSDGNHSLLTGPKLVCIEGQ